MRYTLLNDVETRDWTAYREASERLERYRLGDFSPLDAAVTESFKTERAGDFNLVPVEVVAGACRDVGRLYDMPPTRRFRAARKDQRQALADFYDDNGLNELLGEADRMVHAHQVVVVGFDKLGPGRVRGVLWAPYEVEAVEFDDLLETDLRRAKRVVLRVPVSADGDSTLYGRRVYTPAEAYTEAPGGEKVGVFADDLSNPFGFVPLVARMEAPPAEKGEWFPPINEALLKLQEQVALSVSDILRTARYQCQIRQVLTGGDKSSPVKLEAQKGGTTIWHFPSAEDAPISYSEHAAPPPTKEYWETVSEMLTHYERFAGLTPGALTASTGITGAAKQVELDAVTRRVRARMARAERLERDVLELLLAMGALPSLTTDDRGVALTFHLPRPRGNSLQDEQARAVRYAHGLASPVTDLVEEQGIPEEEARRRVEQNREDVAAYANVGEAVAGLDKNALPVIEGD